VAKEDPAQIYRAAVQRLVELADEVAAERSYDEVAENLAEVRVAVARIYQTHRSRPGEGGQQRILRYLQRYEGEWVSSDEIAAVSGIGEWARRIRELRVEKGYDIEEGGGRYRLLSAQPDTERRERYKTMTRLRESGKPVADRVRELFVTLVGKAVTAEELDRVVRGRGGADVARRLRDDELLPIESQADAPDLRSGEYRLVSAREVDFLHPAQRLFPENLRGQVFTRDRYTCRKCRRRHSPPRPNDEVFYLVVSHLDAEPDAIAGLSGQDLRRLSRLATSCNRCHGKR
jgi:biotin operon repressor